MSRPKVMAKCQGQRSRSKVKGQGQMSRPKVKLKMQRSSSNVKVKGQGHCHDLRKEKVMRTAKRPSRFPHLVAWLTSARTMGYNFNVTLGRVPSFRYTRPRHFKKKKKKKKASESQVLWGGILINLNRK